MAIGVTSLGSVGNTANISAYSCALSRAPADNALLIVAVLAGDVSGTPTEPTSVVAEGLTFSMLTSSVSFDPTTPGSQVHNQSWWRAMGTGLANSLITATFSNTATGCGMLVEEATGLATGSNGANAVGQSATSASNVSLGLQIIGPSATSTANAWLSFAGRGTATQDVTPATNYTSLDSVTHATPSSGMYSAWTTLVSQTTVQWTGGTTEQWAGVLIELVAAAPSTTPAAQWGSGMGGRPMGGYPVRVRGDGWVETGHTESTNPATDTREG